MAAGAGGAFMALLASPIAQADAGAYTDISYIYGDALVYDNSYGLAEDTQFYSDLASSGNILTALGIPEGVATPPGADVPADLNALAAEGNTLTNQLTELHSVAATDAADFKEFPVIGDTLAFQEQINNSIADLPAITGQDATNPLLVADLSGLYGDEVNLSNELINLGDALAIGSPAEITSDNAAIIADALGMAGYAHGASDTLTLLTELSSLGL
jgi:hypothetical protein